jgi:hypothetical protein
LFGQPEWWICYDPIDRVRLDVRRLAAWEKEIADPLQAIIWARMPILIEEDRIPRLSLAIVEYIAGMNRVKTFEKRTNHISSIGGGFPGATKFQPTGLDYVFQ